MAASVRLKRTGLTVKLVQNDCRASAPALAGQGSIQLFLCARAWWQRLSDGKTDSATIAAEEKINASWIPRVIRMNFLAPQIGEASQAGTQPLTITAISLRAADLPERLDDRLARFGV